MSRKPIKLKNNDEFRPPELQSRHKKSSDGAKKHSEPVPKNRDHEVQHHEKHKSQPHSANTAAKNAEKALARQIRKRERILSRLNISVIVAVISVISAFLIFGKRPTVDEDERRELAAMPEFSWSSYFDGSYTGGVSAFFNDAVPSRQTFKNFIALFRSGLGVQYDGGVDIIGKLPVIDDEPTNGSSSNGASVPSSSVSSMPSSGNASGSQKPVQSNVPQSTTVTPPEPVNQEGDMSGTVFVLSDGRGISLFGGNKAGGQDYAETVNRFKQELGDSVNVYSMVIPTAGSFYLPKKYQSLMASEKDNIDHINSFLADVTPIDAYSVLAAHSNEYIYFRTDHHWQQLGAYYAAEEFAKAAGVPFAPLSEYERQDRPGMLGSLYGYSKNSVKMKNNPDTFTYYKPKNDFKVTVYDQNMQNPYRMPLILSDAYYSVNNSYMLYGGDMQVNHVETDVKNGRRLVIIGDSYDNAMFLNLTHSFEEIWVIDMRAHLGYFNYNIIDFIRKKGATDLLFAEDTFSAVDSNKNGLKTMLNSTRMLPEE